MIVAVSLHKTHICVVKSLVKIAAVSWHSLRRFVKPAPGRREVFALPVPACRAGGGDGTRCRCRRPAPRWPRSGSPGSTERARSARSRSSASHRRVAPAGAARRDPPPSGTSGGRPDGCRTDPSTRGRRTGCTRNCCREDEGRDEGRGGGEGGEGEGREGRESDD